jgi:hypothetical protein
MPQRLLNRPAVVAQTPGEVATIYNRSKQMIPIQVAPPGGDFYLSEQQVHLRPGKTVQVAKSHLRWEQIQNLAARGILQVVCDSETQEA